MNVELTENFSQVCVWEGTLVGTDIHNDDS